jgi:hypothetical protein
MYMDNQQIFQANSHINRALNIEYIPIEYMYINHCGSNIPMTK